MERTDGAARFVNATPAAAYHALLDPELLVQWMPPGEMTAVLEHFLPQVPGGYRMVLHYGDRMGQQGKSAPDRDIVDVQFRELVPNCWIGTAVRFVSERQEFREEMEMIWEIREVEGGVEIRVTAQHVPEAISREDHLAGMTSTLAKLANLLEG